MGASEKVELEQGAGQGASQSAMAGGAASRGPSAPFGDTVVTDWHVARPAIDEAMISLEAALVDRASSVALVAPPGMGKSHVLRLLSERIATDRLEILYLPYAGLMMPDLCAWMVGLLGGTCGPDPVKGFTKLLEWIRAQDHALVLLIDDANSMPIETARYMRQLVAAWPGTLRIGLAMSDNARTSRVLAVFGDSMSEVRFHAGMTVEETSAYITNRLDRACASDEIRGRFRPDIVARIQAVTAGLPRRVHMVAEAYLDAKGSTPSAAWIRLVQDRCGPLSMDRTSDMDDSSTPIKAPPDLEI
jgi:type II secretory pathway predicted ATPase ExeA